MQDFENIFEQLHDFNPITLEEMESVRLMNRIDTKYVAGIDKFPLLIPFLKENYCLQQVNNNSVSNYHTIYYDTIDNQMYLRHHNGRKKREKIRSREYVDSEIWFLEIKDKNNKSRTKKIRIPIPNEKISNYDEALGFINNNAEYNFDSISPHLENNFRRLTFVNNNRTERLTIDMDLSFHNLETNKDAALTEIMIIELKQDGNIQSPFKSFLNDLSIQSRSFSKYCIGCALTNDSLKRNRFKKTLMYINKLSHYKYGTIN